MNDRPAPLACNGEFSDVRTAVEDDVAGAEIDLSSGVFLEEKFLSPENSCGLKFNPLWAREKDPFAPDLIRSVPLEASLDTEIRELNRQPVFRCSRSIIRRDRLPSLRDAF